MANICENKFYFYCENNFEDNKKKLIEDIDDYVEIYDISYEPDDSGSCEGIFHSRWTFPKHKLENTFDDMKGVYFRCLSEEYGFCYVAMNIYEDGEWKEEQTFDI